MLRSRAAGSAFLSLLGLWAFGWAMALPTRLSADTTPPVGAILINAGAATTISRSVLLTLAATDDASGVDQMCFSNDGATWTDWEPYLTQRPYVLPPDNGEKTVWVIFADGEGNPSAPATASITLEVPPIVLPGLRQTQTPDPLTVYRGGNSGLHLFDYVDDPAYECLLLTTTLGDIQLRLYQSQTPLTVANFLHYVRDGWYNGTFFHRSEPGFVVQGGGYFADGEGNIQSVPPSGTVQNEFGLSNLRSTVAMAKVAGNPDSATCEWFFNLADNSANLDYQNGGFTAFGEVIPPGMEVVDAMAALPRVNLGGNFTALPVRQLDTDVTFDDLIYINTAAVEPDELQFSVGAAPAGVHATIENGQLACAVDTDAPLAGGPLVLNVTAFDGRTTTLTIPILVEEPDTTAPAGTILINGGAATTDDSNVTFTLDASDDASGVVAMRFSTDNATWNDWQAYAVSIEVTLPADMGFTTVYAQFKDGAGNVSDSATASITILGPVTGTLTINGGTGTATSRSVALTLSAVSSRAALHAMSFSEDGTTWTTWEEYATSRPFVLTPGNGVRTIRVVFADTQGNQSLAVSASVTLAEPPVPLPAPRQLKAISTLTIPLGGKGQLNLAGYADDPAYERVLLKTSLGDIPLRLFEARAPATVANFLRYVDAGRYSGTFFHWAMSGFGVQGGGYFVDDTGTIAAVASYGAVPNEFSAANTRGTIAMVKMSNDPDSATGQWLFNLADNSANLDYLNGGFTVFGDVADMTCVDAIGALPCADLGDPFTNLPAKKVDGATVLLTDLIYLNSVTRQADPLMFTVTGSIPGLSASISSDGSLVILPADAQVVTTGTFTVHASTPDGRVLDLPVPVSVVPLPPPPPGAAPAIVTLTLNHLAKNDGATLWAYLDIVGTYTPTRWSVTGGTAPTGWLDVSGYTVDATDPTRLSFGIRVQIPATAGTRTLTLTLQNPNGLTSAAKTVSVTVPSLSVSAASVKSVTGLTATLSVTATSTADEYAVMDGAWNAVSAVWQPISGGTVSSGKVTFSVPCTLTAQTGTHTINVAVRRTDLGLVSSPRAATTTLTGPSVFSLAVSSVSGITANLSITVTGGPSEYAVMEGAWNAGAADWKPIPPGTISRGRLIFPASFALTPTAGAHTLYVAARDPATHLTSATRTITATLAAPVMAALSSTGVAGTVVTLSIGVTGGPDQYAAMEGVWDAATAVWKTIPPGTTSRGRLTFTASSALTPTTGAHTVYVAARNSALNAVSAARSVTVSVATPVITSMTPSAGGAGRVVVTLSGSAFGAYAAGSSKVEFGGAAAAIQSWTNSQVKCVVPVAAPTGAVNVVLTTSAGFVPTVPRVFTVTAFWLGAWTGTFQDTSDSEAGSGPLKHGWMIVTAAATAATNGLSLQLATGETLTGTLNPADGTVAVSGSGSDGTALSFAGTLLPGSLTGILSWAGPGGVSGTSDLALGFPSVVQPTLIGTYVVNTQDRLDTHGTPLLSRALLLTASQSGQTVTFTDAVVGTRFTGSVAGDVFVAAGGGTTLYGHVTGLDASGRAQNVEGSYEWSDSSGWCWGELTGGRSTGVIGVSTGTTNWVLTVSPAAGGTVALGARVVISSRGNRITATLTGTGLPSHSTAGKIYRNPDGVGSTFVVRDSTLTLYGVLNGITLTGSYEDDTAAGLGSGIFTGSKL